MDTERMRDGMKIIIKNKICLQLWRIFVLLVCISRSVGKDSAFEWDLLIFSLPVFAYKHVFLCTGDLTSIGYSWTQRNAAWILVPSLNNWETGALTSPPQTLLCCEVCEVRGWGWLICKVFFHLKSLMWLLPLLRQQPASTKTLSTWKFWCWHKIWIPLFWNMLGFPGWDMRKPQMHPCSGAGSLQV